MFMEEICLVLEQIPCDSKELFILLETDNGWLIFRLCLYMATSMLRTLRKQKGRFVFL